MGLWFGGQEWEDRRGQDELLEKLARQVIRMFMDGKLEYVEREERTAFDTAAMVARLRAVKRPGRPPRIGVATPLAAVEAGAA